MNTRGKISIKENKMKMTPSTLIRLAGLSAVLAGLGFIVVGMFHPLNVPSAVTTTTWVNVHIVATLMCFFGLFGMAGLYAKQVERSGWLGLAGFVLFSLWLALSMPLLFLEAFVLPRLATGFPAFVEGFLGMLIGVTSEVDLGILPTLWDISGPILILGLLLFGIATFRAGVLPRWAGALFALGAVLIPIGALVPPEYQPELILVPVGLALAWLGSALLSERRALTPEPIPAMELRGAGTD
jgi:hypothetical protein